MKLKQILSSAGIYGGKNLRALIIVAALAQLSFGQAFSISISPLEVTIPPGGTARYTITVISTSTATGSLDFSITGLPPHSTPTISMDSASMYTLTITTSRDTPQGGYDFTVTATNGETSASASARLNVLL